MQCSVECEGQGVRRVIGLRNFLQAQEMEEHPLHVLFRGAPVARDGELQLEGGWLENGALALRCRCDDDAPCVRHIHGAPFVPREEELFDDDDIRACFMEECRKIPGDLREAFGERHGFRPDCEPLRRAHVRWCRHFHGAEADYGDAGVDAENAHGMRVEVFGVWCYARMGFFWYNKQIYA